MKIFITGMCGFIGSHIAEYYVGRDDYVYGIDNMSTGHINNLKEIPADMVVDTVTNRKTMEPLIEKADIVYHMAAPVGVKYIMDNPIKTLLDNVRGTDVVLELCNKYRKPVFIPSSSSIYGKSLDCIPHEKDEKLTEESYCVFGSTQNHRWAYANTKAFDEFLAFAYYKQYRLPVVCVRFFNVIGPRQTGQYGMVVPTFVRQALRGEPLTVYGDGTQARCFGSVHDMVRIITQLMTKQEAYGQMYNLGAPYHISINELAGLVLGLTKSSSRIVHVNFEEAYGEGYEEMMSKEPDISKLRKLMPVEFEYDLIPTVQEIIDYEWKRL